MAEWFTTEGETPEAATAAQERLEAAWPVAPLENLEVCGMILDVAREQVEAYGEQPTTVDPPARFVYAQLQQANNLWNAGRVSTEGNIGGDSFTFTPRPLDKTVRGIIRPVNGGPDVY